MGTQGGSQQREGKWSRQQWGQEPGGHPRRQDIATLDLEQAWLLVSPHTWLDSRSSAPSPPHKEGPLQGAEQGRRAFAKGLERKGFRLCGSYGLCVTTQLLCHSVKAATDTRGGKKCVTVYQ